MILYQNNLNKREKEDYEEVFKTKFFYRNSLKTG